MQSASSIREHAVVTATPPGNDVVIPGVTSPRASAICHGVINTLAADAVSLVDRHLQSALAEQQNPYREAVVIGAEQARYAARVALFPEGRLAEGLNKAFEGSAESSPDATALVGPLADAIARRLAGFGYELCGKNTGAGSDLLEIAVRDPIYVAKLIEDRARQHRLHRGVGHQQCDAVALEWRAIDARGGAAKLSQGMGVTAVGQPEQLLALRALVDDICMMSVVTVTSCLERFVESGTSPFSRPYFNLSGAVVPGRSVSRGEWGGYDVRNAAVVKLQEVDAVMARMRALAVDGLVVHEDTFMSQVDKAIAERFAQLPALQVVVVGRHAESVNGATVVSFVAVCAEKPRRTLRKYLRDLLGGSPRLALPPPPKALVAPTVIPPVTKGRYARVPAAGPELG